MNHPSTAFRDSALAGAITCRSRQPARCVSKNTFATACIVFILAGAALLSGCELQNVREQAVKPSASEAPLNAVMVEPGPPPPDMASPSDAVIFERLRLRTTKRREQAGRGPLDAETDRGYVDIWAHIRSGMRFPDVNHATVQAELAWYAERPEYIQHTTDRARLYLGHIVHEAKRRNLPLELTLLPFVESAFQPYARSPVGATGIWQFMRSTGHYYGLEQTSWSDARRDIVQATRAAFDYLEKLHKDMDGDWLLAVAAYNAGEGNVLRAVRKNRAGGTPTDFFSLSLPAETRAYVPRLLALSKLIARPADYDLELDPIDDEPYFQLVDTGGRLNLAKAAEMAGIELNELMLLNPALVGDSTDPGGPHSLAIPVGSVAVFRNALAATPKEQRAPWSQVKVVGGDTLSTIAERHGVTVSTLRETNNLRTDTIRMGQQLRIPGRQASATVSAMAQQLSPEVRRGRAQARRNEQRTIYRVRSGDSLWSIASKHRTTISRLRQWNGLSKRKILRPGQKLVIWRSKSGTKARSRPRSSPTNANTHLVRNGDNLWSIAKRYRLRTADLARWNDIEAADTLRPGHKLRLKAPEAV